MNNWTRINIRVQCKKFEAKENSKGIKVKCIVADESGKARLKAKSKKLDVSAIGEDKVVNIVNAFAYYQ